MSASLAVLFAPFASANARAHDALSGEDREVLAVKLEIAALEMSAIYKSQIDNLNSRARAATEKLDTILRDEFLGEENQLRTTHLAWMTSLDRGCLSSLACRFEKTTDRIKELTDSSL